MKISILMANFNNARYIRKAIESVINQTFVDWELLIIDDCSTDNSVRIAQNYLSNKKIKLIEQPENFGYGAALKLGANVAEGEILAILDSDDALADDALEQVMNEYNNGDFDFVYSTYYQCDNDLRINKIADWVREIKTGDSDLLNPQVSHFKTFKKSAYLLTSGFDEKQKRAVDRDIIYKLEEVAKPKFINKPLYYYRANALGISQESNAREAGLYKVLSMHKAYLRRGGTRMPNYRKEEMVYILFKEVERLIEEANWQWAQLLGRKLLHPKNFSLKSVIKLLHKYFQRIICQLRRRDNKECQK